MDGLYRVLIDGGYNIFDAENKRLLYKDGFIHFNRFVNGFAKVEYSGNLNYLKVNGELLLPKENSLDICDDFNRDGIAIVKTEQGYNYITSNGEFLCPDMFFTYVYHFHDDIAIVSYENGYNLLNKSGKLLYDSLFENIKYISREEVYNVEYKDGGFNVLNWNGEALSPVRLKRIEPYGFISRVELFDGRELRFNIETGLFYDAKGVNYRNPVDINNPSQEEQKIELTESMLRNIITEVIKDVYRI